MPRAFSSKEKEAIKESLFANAEQHLTIYGGRKTTVDELVKAANVSKGTFYQFFDSKV